MNAQGQQGNLEAEALRKRISFLEELCKASYVTPEKRREYQRTLTECHVKLMSIGFGR